MSALSILGRKHIKEVTIRYLVFLSTFMLFAACSDSPNSPGGTLPVVQNCRIMETECKGDTVIIAWDAVAVEVDGYKLWFADTDPGIWNTIAQVDSTVTRHIAVNAGFYCVEAIKGTDTSESYSNKVDTEAFCLLSIQDTLTVGGINGFRFEPDQTTVGSAADSGFAQDLYIALISDSIAILKGDYNPASFPGGSSSMISVADLFVAPKPGDAAWKDLVYPCIGISRYFVQLENGDYAYLSVTQDSLYENSVVLHTTQYQGITGLRLFNYLIF